MTSLEPRAPASTPDKWDSNTARLVGFLHVRARPPAQRRPGDAGVLLRLPSQPSARTQPRPPSGCPRMTLPLSLLTFTAGRLHVPGAGPRALALSQWRLSGGHYRCVLPAESDQGNSEKGRGPTRPSQLEVQCPPGLSLFTAVAHGRRAGNPSRSLQLMLWVTTTHRGQRMCPAMVWLSPLYRGGKGPAHVLPVTAAIHGSQKGQPLLRAPCALGLKYSSSSDTGARRGRRLAPGDPAQEQGLRAQQPGPSWHHVPWAPRPASSRGASQSPFSPDQPRSAPLPTRPSSAFCLQDKTPPSERVLSLVLRQPPPARPRLSLRLCLPRRRRRQPGTAERRGLAFCQGIN